MSFEPFIENLKKIHLRLVRPSFAHSYEMAARIAREKGFDVPSKSTARSRIRADIQRFEIETRARGALR